MRKQEIEHAPMLSIESIVEAVISGLTAIIFTGLAGWYFGKGILQWWFIVPWIASICDAVTASWIGINNAAQKPFLSQRGTM